MARSFAFPVYQIDFAAVQAGKRLSATKRRIRWYVLFLLLSSFDVVGTTRQRDDRRPTRSKNNADCNLARKCGNCDRQQPPALYCCLYFTSFIA
jgi:hypothetical protein